MEPTGSWRSVRERPRGRPCWRGSGTWRRRRGWTTRSSWPRPLPTSSPRRRPGARCCASPRVSSRPRRRRRRGPARAGRPPSGVSRAGCRASGLGLDLHLHLADHVGVELHAHLEVAERLERLGEVDGAPVDLDAARGERLGEVHGGDGSVQLVLLAHLALERERGVGEAPGDGLGAGLELRGLGRGHRLLVLHLADVLGVGEDCQAAGDEEVAPVAGLHLHELAALAQVVHVFSEDELHVSLLGRRNGVGQERQHAGPLDGGGHVALVLRAVAADAPGNDLAALGEEVLELPLVLVVDLGGLLGAEPADLAAAEAPPASTLLAVAVAAAATAAALVAVAAAAEAAAATTAAEAASATTAEAAATRTTEAATSATR